MLKVPMLRSIPLFAMLGCAACVSAPPIISTPSACSTLLPADWLAGVAGVPLPDGDTIADWIAALDAQTGKLDAANDRYRAAVGVVGRCEERDKAAVKASRPKFLGIF